MDSGLAIAWTSQLADGARAEALRVGFHLASIVPAEPDPQDADYLTAWLAAGHAGEMHYLKRTDEHGQHLRSDLRHALPWARSVMVCALNYNTLPERSIDPAPASSGWIARYAWSGRPIGRPSGSAPEADAASLPTDYHDVLLDRLHKVEAFLQQRQPCQARCYVDTGPILERSLAARAGLGWIGKNTCIIDQHLGSWLLLGVIVTSLESPPPVALAPDRCGSCTRCIDACPTDALIAPHQMDASRCIAYLTIEKKGTIAEDLRPLMGRQIFGCDICQDVCPWNSRSPIAVNSDLAPRRELVNPPLAALAQLDSAAFNKLFKGSPLERTGRHRLQRNIAIAMGNSGDPAHLPQLHLWSRSDNPGLAEAASWACELLARSGDRRPADSAPSTPPPETAPTIAPKTVGVC